MFNITPDEQFDDDIEEMIEYIAEIVSTPQEALNLVERFIQRAGQMRQEDWPSRIADAQQKAQLFRDAGTPLDDEEE